MKHSLRQLDELDSWIFMRHTMKQQGFITSASFYASFESESPIFSLYRHKNFKSKAFYVELHKSHVAFWSGHGHARSRNIAFVFSCISVQGTTKRLGSGLVNFVTALAYHFCLNFPAAFTQPGDHLSAEPCSPTVSLLKI